MTLLLSFHVLYSLIFSIEQKHYLYVLFRCHTPFIEIWRNSVWPNYKFSKEPTSRAHCPPVTLPSLHLREYFFKYLKLNAVSPTVKANSTAAAAWLWDSSRLVLSAEAPPFAAHFGLSPPCRRQWFAWVRLFKFKNGCRFLPFNVWSGFKTF